MSIQRVVDALYCASPFGPSGSYDGPAYQACGVWAHPVGYAIIAVIVASLILTVAAVVCVVKGPSFEVLFGGAFATIFGGFLWFLTIGLLCAAVVPSVIVGSLFVVKEIGAGFRTRKIIAEREASAKIRLVDEWLAASSEGRAP